jgi:hypothetical protein
MKLYILISFIFFYNFTFCQTEKLDKIIHKRIERLQNKNIDTIGVYKIHGEYMITPKCGATTAYIFWIEQTVIKIIKVNGCKISRSKKLLDKDILEFYYSNQNSIDKETLDNFITEDGGLVSTSHYKKNSITIYDNNKTKTWEINNFYLIRNSGDYININYDKNIDLKLIQWKNLIDKKIINLFK